MSGPCEDVPMWGRRVDKPTNALITVAPGAQLAKLPHSEASKCSTRYQRSHFITRPTEKPLSYTLLAMHAQTHRSDPRTLSRRTLQTDHRHLAGLLRPGHSVLDAGCGTGAITSGIAKAVGPNGQVTGVDRNEELLAIARTEHGELPNLRFETGDATSLDYVAQFDLVTAARVIQWIGEPALAISRMKHAIKPGGLLVVLDYNHSQNAWDPEAPPEFRSFYQAFLDWRSANHWDNEMADHLPRLFQSAGLVEVESHLQDEVTERGAPDFAERSTIWSDVIESVGEQIAKAGFCNETQLQQSRECYATWIRTDLKKQTLVMRTVTGRRS